MREDAPVVELRAQGPARYRRLVGGEHESVAIGVQHDEIQADVGVELDDVDLATEVLDVDRRGVTVRPRAVLDALEAHVDAPGRYEFVDPDDWSITLSGRTEAWRVLALALAHEVAVGRVTDADVAGRACRILLTIADHTGSDRPLFAVVGLVEDLGDAMDNGEGLADRARDRMGGDGGGDADA